VNSLFPDTHYPAMSTLAQILWPPGPRGAGILLRGE
jgi:hypothetical protein